MHERCLDPIINRWLIQFLNLYNFFFLFFFNFRVIKILINWENKLKMYEFPILPLVHPG